MIAFLDAVAWVFGALSLIRLVGVTIGSFKYMGEDEATNNKIISIICRAQTKPAIIFILCVLWIIFGGDVWVRTTLQ